MPIARIRVPDGRIARVQVAEGTSPEEATKIAMDQYAKENPPAATEAAPQPDTGAPDPNAGNPIADLIRGTPAPNPVQEAQAATPDQLERAARLRPTEPFTTRPTDDQDRSLVSGLYSTLEVIDRPLSAIVGAITAPEGQSWEAFKAGLKGEQHPKMGDYIFAKLEDARAHPEQYPALTHIRDFLGKRIEFNIPADWRAEALGKHTWGGIKQEPIEKTEAAMATIGGIATDIALDPVTYTGVGLTNKGLTELAVSTARKEGRELPEAMVKRMKALEKKGDIQAFRKTLADQLEAGQARVRVAGIPVPAQLAASTVRATQAFKEYIKGTPLGESFTQAFSTKAGLTEDISQFAELEERLNNIIIRGRDAAVREGADFAKEVKTFADDIAATTGKAVPVEDINRIIVEEVERAKRSAFVNDAPVEDVVNGASRLHRNWRDTAKMWDAKLRQYVRPEALDDQTKALIMSHPTVRKFVEGLKTKNAEQIRNEIDAGVRISELGATDELHLQKMEAAIQEAKTAGLDKMQNPITKKPIGVASLEERVAKLRKAQADQEQLDYFVHAITPEAKKVVEKMSRRKGKVAGRQYSVQHASTLQRRLQGKSISEINDLARSGKLPGYEGIKINQFFYDDPAIAQTLRDIRHRKAMAVADFFEQTKAEFGVSIKDLRDKAVEATGRKRIKMDEVIPEGYSVVRNPKAAALLKGYAFPDEIAKRLDAHYEALLDPAKTSAFLDMYDGVQNWWKAWTLGVFPAYHTRNVAGNLWNNFVTGTTDMQVYRIAQQIQNGKQGVLHTASGNIPFDEIRKHLDELGIRNRGFMGTDIEESIKAEMGKARWLTLSRDSKLIHYGKKLGTGLENNARIGKFVDELAKGRDFAEAAKNTQHALFDYTDLTQFEKKIAKRLMPFYTWTRKNIPLQVEAMLKSPGKYKAIDTMRQEIEANTQDPNEYVMADWMLENYPIRVKIDETDGKPRYFMLGGWLPAADLWSLASNPPQVFLDLLTPLVKTPLEIATNKDWFTWNDIQHYEAEKVSFMGDNFRVSPYTKKALNNIRLLATIDRMLPQSYKGIMPQSVRDQTPDEKVLEIMTGIKLYGLDLQQQRSFNVKDTADKINKLGYYKGLAGLKQKHVSKSEKAGIQQELTREIGRVSKIYGKKPAPKRPTR